MSQKIKNADVKTFEVLEYNYSKDKNNVYYKDKKIENADPKTFEILDERTSLSKDKNNYYEYGKRVEKN